MQYSHILPDSIENRVISTEAPEWELDKSLQDLLIHDYDYSKTSFSSSPPIVANDTVSNVRKPSDTKQVNGAGGQVNHSRAEDSDYATSDLSESSDVGDDDNSCIFSFSKVPMQKDVASIKEEERLDPKISTLNNIDAIANLKLTNMVESSQAVNLTSSKQSSINQQSSVSTDYDDLRSISEESFHLSQGEIPLTFPMNSSLTDTEADAVVAVDALFPGKQRGTHNTVNKARSVSNAKAPTSALRALLEHKENSSQNGPLAENFATFSGHAESNALRLNIYFPSSESPSKPLFVELRKNVLVSEAIGYILLQYVNQQLVPPIEDEAQNPNYWNLRIVEDDGELDEDFPALDRVGPLSKFGFDAFALVKATPAQIKENQAAYPFKSKHPTSIPEANNKTHIRHTSSTSSQSQKQAQDVKDTLNTSHVVQVRLPPYGDNARFCNIEISKTTRLAMVLNQVCWMKQLERFKYTLRVAGSDTVLPLDKTFSSLDGNPTLELVKKKVRDKKGSTQQLPTSSPQNSVYGSIKKDAQSSTYNATDIMSSNTYQEFLVWKRQPVSFMGRHERLLAIDGEYVHIMPSESKNIFETPKTSSIHAGSIILCKQSKKSPCNFKMIVSKNRETKRYDFEVLSALEAAIIVSRIRALMNTVKKIN
ncbi:Target of rapamycin complex 2 subunit sin1 [Schizosaccharomyces pombe]